MYPHKLYSAVWNWIFWVSHLILLTASICCIAYFFLGYDGRDLSDGSKHNVPAGYAFAFALVVFNFISEPVEMVLWAHHLLDPWAFLTLNILKSLLWSAVGGLGIYVTLTVDGVRPDFLRDIVAAILGLTALSMYASLIYSIVLCIRMRRRTGYTSMISEKEPVEYGYANMSGAIQEPGRARPASSIYE